MAGENKGCYLYSNANYSVRIQYNGKTLMLPPYATRVRIADESKLGKLPDKIRKISMSSNNNNSPIVKRPNKPSKEDGGTK